MKYYAVVDTNVIVSSMLRHDSIPGAIVDLIINKTIVPLLNDEIFDEYRDVLLRNKFGFDSEVVEKALQIIRENALFLEREQTLEDFIDIDET